MGIFFVSIVIRLRRDIASIVSVPYGDLFCFYEDLRFEWDEKKNEFPSPMGIFFVSIKLKLETQYGAEYVSVPYGDLFCFYMKKIDDFNLKLICFRPLWGSFLFLLN